MAHERRYSAFEVPHVFGVLRIDDGWVVGAAPENCVSLTGVFNSERGAEADAERLSELAREKGLSSRYVILTSRLKG